MSSIIESINNMLSGDTLNKVSKQVGLPEDKAKQVIPDVLAVITGALANNSSKKKEAKLLFRAN